MAMKAEKNEVSPLVARPEDDQVASIQGLRTLLTTAILLKHLCNLVPAMGPRLVSGQGEEDPATTDGGMSAALAGSQDPGVEEQVWPNVAIPTHPTPSQPNPPNPIPSHPIPFHLIPSHPIPSHGPDVCTHAPGFMVWPVPPMWLMPLILCVATMLLKGVSSHARE